MTSPLNVEFQDHNWNWNNLPALSTSYNDPLCYTRYFATGITGIVADYLKPPHRFVTVKPWEGFRFEWITPRRLLILSECLKVSILGTMFIGTTAFNIALPFAARNLNLTNLLQYPIPLGSGNLYPVAILITLAIHTPLFYAARYHNHITQAIYNGLTRCKVKLISNYYKAEGSKQMDNLLSNMKSAKDYFKKLSDDYNDKITNKLQDDADSIEKFATSYFTELDRILSNLSDQYNFKYYTFDTKFFGNYKFLPTLSVDSFIPINTIKDTIVNAARDPAQLIDAKREFLHTIHMVNINFETGISNIVQANTSLNKILTRPLFTLAPLIPFDMLFSQLRKNPAPLFLP